MSKDDFMEMIRDWQSDNAEEYGELEITEAETDEAGNIVAYAEDKNNTYSLTDDGTGNISINYMGTK